MQNSTTTIRNHFHPKLAGADLNNESNREGLTKLLSLEVVDVSLPVFLVNFLKLRNDAKYPIIKELCRPENRFLHFFKSPSEQAKVYKKQLELLRTAQNNNGLYYFNNAVSNRSSIGCKLHEIRIAKLKTIYLDGQSALPQDIQEFTDLSHFNHNIGYFENFTNSNLDLLSNTNFDLLNGYIRTKPEFSCLLNQNVDNLIHANPNCKNISGKLIAAIKAEFLKEMEIADNEPIFQGNKLNSQIGTKIQDKYLDRKKKATKIEVAYKKYRADQVSGSPAALNFSDNHSEGYCQGLSALFNVLSTKTVYSLQDQYSRGQLSLKEDLKNIQVWLNHSQEYVRNALLAVLDVYSSKQMQPLIEQLNNPDISRLAIIEVVNTLAKDNIFQTQIASDANGGLYGYFINLYQHGQLPNSPHLLMKNKKQIKRLIIDVLGTNLDEFKANNKLSRAYIPFGVGNQTNSGRITDTHAVGIRLTEHSLKSKGTQSTIIKITFLDPNNPSFPIITFLNPSKEAAVGQIIENFADQVNHYLLNKAAFSIAYTNNLDRRMDTSALKNSDYSIKTIIKTIQTNVGQASYEGDSVNGRLTGNGKATWSDGTKYEGKWVDGKVTGHGIYILPNGTQYEGDFINGVIIGQVIYTWPDGAKDKNKNDQMAQSKILESIMKGDFMKTSIA